MFEFQHLILTHYVLTGALTAIGIAIAFGPEIRLAVARARHQHREAESPLAQGHVVAH